jgi:hypothetical protein
MTRNSIQRWEATITIEGQRHQIGAAWTAFVEARGLEAYAHR